MSNLPRREKEKITMEKEIYNGKLKIKLVESGDFHSYYISERKGKEWGPWIRKTGSTTIGGIKDKSGPLKYWVAKIMARFLHAILNERTLTRYDIDEARGLHAKRLKEAGDLGGKIHDWIKEYVAGRKPEIPAEEAVLRGVNAFLEWEKETKVKFIASEEPIFSKEYDYCGKLDAIGKINGKLYLIDYKTGTGLYNDVMMQTASYVEAWEEMGGEKIAGRWAVRIEKRNEDEFKADMEEKDKVNEKYIPFETIYLDDNKENRILDFAAFLNAKKLRDWDIESSKRLIEYKTK